MLSALVFSALSGALAEENEVVFTASKFDESIKDVGASIDIVTEKNLQQGQYQRVSDVLATLPGINVTQNSSNGFSNVFIRGIGIESSLVLVDGVVVNDPADSGRGFNFSGFNLLNIDRIEVLKGPQSTLYGSNAMGGVIQIFTKQGGKQETTLKIEGGRYDHIKTSFQTQGMTDQWQYSVALGLEQERGISSADVKMGNMEADRFKSRNGAIHVNYAPTDFLNFDVMLRYNRYRNDYDAFAGEGGDDKYLYQKTTQWVGRFAINTILLDEKWESSLIYDVSNTRRRNYNDPDGINIPYWMQPVGVSLPYISETYERAGYHGRIDTISWRNVLELHPNFKTLFGVSSAREQASTYYFSKSGFDEYAYTIESELPKHRITLNSIYIDQHFDFYDKFFNTIGVRYDDHSTFGSKLTYRLTSRYNINDYISIKGSYGTGFKAPSLYQLYEPTYGDASLNAERSRGYDIGIVLYPHRSTEVSLTYFNQKFKDKVDFDSATSRYINRGRVETKGWEFSTETTLNSVWSFGMNYTYLDAKEQIERENVLTKLTYSSKQRLDRRPRHMVGIHVNMKPNERTNFYVEGSYHGSFMDNKSWGKPSEKMKPFWLVNVAASYQINDTVSLTGRVDNLLDKQYTTVYGYGQKRIAGYIGLTVKF